MKRRSVFVSMIGDDEDESDMDHITYCGHSNTYVLLP